jgi:hypothetical protein
VHVLDQCPKLDKLGKVLHGDCRPIRKLSNPLVIVKSLGHLPVLPLANFEDFWGNVLSSLPL